MDVQVLEIDSKVSLRPKYMSTVYIILCFLQDSEPTSQETRKREVYNCFSRGEYKICTGNFRTVSWKVW